MSHFYGDLQGSRGEATRCGTAWSGISSHVRGWHVGARASMRVEDGQDVASIAATAGSAGSGYGQAIGSVRLDEDGSTLVLEPSAWTVSQVQRWQRAERKRLRLAAKLAEREARRERYRKLRQDARYSASTAWHYASQPEAPALDWTEDGHGWTAKLVASGYSVSVQARPDYDADYWTRGKFTDSWSADVVALPEPRERGTFRYWLPDVSYREHRRGLAALGYARHAADCLARQYVRQDLDVASHGREAVYVVATAYLAGVELGSSSIGGCELGKTHGTDSTPLERQLDALVEDYGLVSEAVSEAKSARAKLVQTGGQ
jgi:hypothetical protein